VPETLYEDDTDICKTQQPVNDQIGFTCHSCTKDIEEGVQWMPSQDDMVYAIHKPSNNNAFAHMFKR
jgi:hypothetical protein